MLWDITLKLDKNHIKQPEPIKVSGELKIFGVPHPPAFIFVHLIDKDDNVVETSRLTVGIPTVTAGLTSGFGFSAGGYEGTVEPKEIGMYKVKAVFTGTPLPQGPVLGESESIPLIVGEAAFSLVGSAYYNGQPSGTKGIPLIPGEELKVVFSFIHVGPPEVIYAGFILARSRATGHGSPADVPMEGYFSAPFSVGSDPGRKDYTVEVSGLFPTGGYYEGPGSFDVLRLITATEPYPYLAEKRMDDDWDDDIYQYAGLEPSVKVMTFDYAEITS